MNPADNHKRLGRPSVSCSVCRKRKLKCDRAYPCGNCLRSRSKNPGEDCVYEESDRLNTTSVEPSSKRRALSPSTSQHSPNTQAILTPEHSTSTTSRPVTISDRIGQSGGLVPRDSETASSAPIQFRASTPESAEASNLHSGRSCKVRYLIEDSFFGETCELVGGVSHKSRVFGQSSWLAIILHFKELVEITAPYLRDEHAKAVIGLKKCKSLARSIKAQWSPTWPTLPTTLLPPRELADELVDAYLQTTETLYKVLHIPSFRREYENLWLQWPEVSPNKAFLVLLKLVLAIGATTYDENFSLRSSAVTWVYEAQTYLSDPQTKSRLGLQYLQTNILLLIAREATGVDSDSVWVSAGSLIRTAISIGLHKDPTGLLAGSVPAIVSEMRRRLWNTILELALQSSIDSGKPPLISLNDFDTQCPGNLDDEQLGADGEASLPKPYTQFTSVSIAIALRKTFPVRLAIAKLLNDQGRQCTHDETLRLDRELRTLYKETMSTLRKSMADAWSGASRFDACALDVIIYRYIAALHVPFLGSGPDETASAYSRKAAVDSAFRIHLHTSGSSRETVVDSPGIAGGSGDTFRRYTRSSSGFFPRAVFQADLIVAVELKTQLREQLGFHFGPLILRPDLLAVLEDSKQFSLRCIEAGETNIKGYLFRSIATAHIKGVQKGLEGDSLRDMVVKSAEDVVDECIPLLENMLLSSGGNGNQDEVTNRSSTVPQKETPADAPEYWDHLVSEDMFNPTGSISDLLSWMVTDDITKGFKFVATSSVPPSHWFSQSRDHSSILLCFTEKI